MRKRFNPAHTAAAALLCAAAWLLPASCDNGSDCSLSNVAYSRYAFCNSRGEAVVFADTLSVYLRVNGKDSTVVNRSTGTGSLTLPVSYTQQVDTLIFRYAYRLADTLYMEHQNIPYFISLDCGTAMYHHATGIGSSHTYIDSIKITDPQINYDERENFKIYFAD